MSNNEIIRRNLGKRYAKEMRFKYYGLGAIILSISFLLFLLINITSKAIPAFTQTYIKLDIDLSAKTLGLSKHPRYSSQELFAARYGHTLNAALYQLFPEVTARSKKRALKSMISSGAHYNLRDFVINNPELIGKKISLWLLASDKTDSFIKGLISRSFA